MAALSDDVKLALLSNALERANSDVQSHFVFLQNYFRGLFAVNSGLVVIAATLLDKLCLSEISFVSYISAVVIGVGGAVLAAQSSHEKAREQLGHFLIWEDIARESVRRMDQGAMTMFSLVDEIFAVRFDRDIRRHERRRVWMGRLSGGGALLGIVLVMVGAAVSARLRLVSPPIAALVQ